MAKVLKALKVIVGIGEDGKAAYPNFNLISDVIRERMDWSTYIDVNGGGWHYDKTSGHKEDTPDSPEGQQIACLCVPEAFYDEAILMFGPGGTGQISAMTEAEFEVFHDTKAHAHENDELLDTDRLTGLNSQRQLMKSLGQDTVDLDAKITRALDPNTNESGVKKNHGRLWKDAKKNQAITIKP